MVIGYATACAPYGKARSNHYRKACGTRLFGNVFLYLPSLLHAMCDARLSRLKANTRHSVFELEPIFGLVDGLGICPYKLDTMFLEYPLAVEVKGTIKSCLPPHGGQECVGALVLNNFLDCAPSDGLDVGDIGRIGVSHNCGGVAIDQNGAVACVFEGFTGLGARVIKLAGLTDNNRARANN